MNILRRCGILLLAATLTLCLAAQTSLPDYPDTLGVSAPFAGMVGDRLIVAGGCNFPDVPAADGGTKAYRTDVYALAADGGQWERLAYLPEALAYGASVETEEGLLCLGGSNAGGTHTGVYHLTTDTDGRLHIDTLPSLPVPLDNGGAARIDHTVYVTGGNQGGRKGLYALDLNTLTWRRLRDYPGEVRQQPVVIAADGVLYLMGGYTYDATARICHTAHRILAYTPATDRWHTVGRLPKELDRCLVGAAGIAATDGSRLLVTGGVNGPLFRSAVEGHAPQDYLRQPAPWYQFHHTLYVYDLHKKRWRSTVGPSTLARAGGLVVRRGDTLVMVCGEEKPGIRSPRLTAFPWPEEK